MEDRMKFKINDETYDMVQKGLTFAEARAFEKVSGFSINDVQGEAQKNVNVIQGLLWISMKRVAPTTTFADLDDIAMDEIEWIPEEGEVPGEGESSDPTAPAPTEAGADVAVESAQAG